MEQLLTDADMHPMDSAKQARLWRELNRNSDGAKQVVRRVESGRYTIDDIGLKEYVRALSVSGKLDAISDVKKHLLSLKIEPQHVYRVTQEEVQYQQPTTPQSNFTNGTATFRFDPAQTPFPVVLAGSNRSYFWKFLYGVGSLLIGVAGLSVFFESNLQSKLDMMGSGGKKIEPVKDIKTTFKDVKGCEEVKAELTEIIEYLKNPGKFTRLGAKLPKGVLLVGPPGTGKTLVARAVAGEASVPFIQASGSEFEEMFVGVGARRIRDMFAAARKLAPCILFIDEIDAVGGKRSKEGASYTRMTLNQLLVELDGFEKAEGVVVICATNFAESLDKALTRPGRLDKIVTVNPPDIKGRMEILEMYGKKLRLAPTVDMQTIARRAVGMTGADLFNILNIAAIRAAADNLDSITMDVLDDAFDRVVMGLERKTPISEDERRMTAYHEAGHAIVGMYTKGANQVQKASIIPRGNSLGVTYSAPETDKHSQKLFELEAMLAVAMGGKVAEEAIYGPGNVSGGCANDLKQASSLARVMVMKYGMGSDDPMKPAILFLDADDYTSLSDRAKAEVDASVERLLRKAYDYAKATITSRSKEMSRLAEALVEFETLDRAEMDRACVGDFKKIRDERATQSERKKNERAANTARLEPSTVIVREVGKVA